MGEAVEDALFAALRDAGPRSSSSITGPRRPIRAMISTGSPSGEYLAASSMRFRSAWWRRTASAHTRGRAGSIAVLTARPSGRPDVSPMAAAITSVRSAGSISGETAPSLMQVRSRRSERNLSIRRASLRTVHQVRLLARRRDRLGRRRYRGERCTQVVAEGGEERRAQAVALAHDLHPPHVAFQLEAFAVRVFVLVPAGSLCSNARSAAALSMGPSSGFDCPEAVMRAVPPAVQDDGLHRQKAAHLRADDRRRLGGVFLRRRGWSRTAPAPRSRARSASPARPPPGPARRAGDEGDGDEQDRGEDVHRPVDGERVEARQEEEVVGDAGRDGRHQARAVAVEAGGHDHRQKVEEVDRSVADPALGEMGGLGEARHRSDRDQVARPLPARHEPPPVAGGDSPAAGATCTAVPAPRSRLASTILRRSPNHRVRRRRRPGTRWVARVSRHWTRIASRTEVAGTECRLAPNVETSERVRARRVFSRSLAPREPGVSTWRVMSGAFRASARR